MITSSWEVMTEECAGLTSTSPASHIASLGELATAQHCYNDVCVCRQHRQAVRGVSYHPRYPLFASCSDDATITVCHGMVYE